MLEKTVPEDKVNFFVIFWLFILGSLAGSVLEGIWDVFKTGHWVYHTATVWGPFNIIYGIGLAVMYISSCYVKKTGVIPTYMSFVVTGSVVEYGGSLIQETLFGSTSWDYSSSPFNLNGRITLSMSLIWGLLGLAFMYLIYPKVTRWLTITTNKTFQAITIAFFIFMVVDLSVTSVAIVRWKERSENIPPSSKIESVVDTICDDAKMEKVFSNMVFDEIKTIKPLS